MIIQYAALPYWLHPQSGLQILLVTSRETGRWVIPKGNPIRHLSGWQTAEQEAFEEAGVKGTVENESIGMFHYRKRKRLSLPVHARVHVFPLQVESLLASWPEARQRRRQWFAPAEAATAVHEPSLRRLLVGFSR